ncbi:hypothetical protein D5R93_05795 [Actinomyces lilanjuaniae]|uniref:HNH nuclease domain-containing protein n=1 Tax=Actinomyces lilanjuaniae TaxID=2321394 RepID=A0ABM6Z333_9ACTO|nr:HNH endonuclease [Actinomyces lilanjuaniae]AYD89684.1 hypothetical protein D5R93_05795 [Actinomyces lilanjuaniae]
MSWFVVDDQAFQHPKHQALMRRGLGGDADAFGAGFLWMMVGSRAKAAHGDGVVDIYDVVQVAPDPVRVHRFATILVEVGLWHDSEHGCERCPPVEPGQWRYHDWTQWHKKTGDEERMIQALRTERSDPRMHKAVWERDRLPDDRKKDPDGPDEAVCAYCQKHLSRATKEGRLAPEVDHVLPRALGQDNLVIACHGCNRQKGNRPPKAANLTLHLTRAHEEALAARDSRPHSKESAGLYAAILASDESLLGQEAPSPVQTPPPPSHDDEEEQEPGPHSPHPGDAAPDPEEERPHPARPPEVAGCPPTGPGQHDPEVAGQEDPGPSFPFSPGAGGESDSTVGAAGPVRPPTPERQKTPIAPFNGWSLPFSGAFAEALSTSASAENTDSLVMQAAPDRGGSAPVVSQAVDCSAPQQVAPVTAVATTRSSAAGPAAGSPQSDLPAALATASHARAGVPTCGRTRAHAPAIAGTRGLAGQGRARQGTAPAQPPPTVPVPDPPPRRRRRRRRGQGRGRGYRRHRQTWTCTEHGDRLPCRLCQVSTVTSVEE